MLNTLLNYMIRRLSLMTVLRDWLQSLGCHYIPEYHQAGNQAPYKLSQEW